MDAPNKPRWSKEGWLIFPCVSWADDDPAKQAHKRGKSPLTPNGHHDASRDPKQIRLWREQFKNCNWGLPAEANGLAVVDLDSAAAQEKWEELKLEHGQVETYTVMTPRGKHLYFEGEIKNTAGTEKAGIAPGIDTRGDGYVMLPGSFVNGVTYTEENPNAPIAKLPAWVAELSGRKHEAAKANPDVKLDQPQNLARARASLVARVASGKIAIEGQGGDSLTYATAAEILNFGISADAALDLICELWNPHCIPPWTRDELAVKIGNASQYAQNEAGSWAVLPAAERIPALDKLLQDSVAASAQEQSDNGPVLFSELLNRRVEPVQELIAGQVERGVANFLNGGGGGGKSTLAIQEGLSIDGGVSVHGLTVQKATFVYYSTEDDANEVTRRVQKITRGLQLPTGGRGQYFDRVGKDSALAILSEGSGCELTSFYDEMCANLRAIEGHKYVVLDSCYNFLRFHGKAKIDEGSVNTAIGVFQRICAETNSTLQILWHPSQAGQDRGDASGWSVAWHNAPRAKRSITPNKDVEGAYELKVEKRNHGPKGKPIALCWSDGVFLPHGSGDTSTLDQHNARFMDACIAVAIKAAERAIPLQEKARIAHWAVHDLDLALGWKPKERAIKETLLLAVSSGKLCSISTSRHRKAGFYPPDQGQAIEMAKAAKKADADMKKGVSDV